MLFTNKIHLKAYFKRLSMLMFSFLILSGLKAMEKIEFMDSDSMNDLCLVIIEDAKKSNCIFGGFDEVAGLNRCLTKIKSINFNEVNWEQVKMNLDQIGDFESYIGGANTGLKYRTNEYYKTDIFFGRYFTSFGGNSVYNNGYDNVINVKDKLLSSLLVSYIIKNDYRFLLIYEIYKEKENNKKNIMDQFKKDLLDILHNLELKKKEQLENIQSSYELQSIECSVPVDNNLDFNLSRMQQNIVGILSQRVNGFKDDSAKLSIEIATRLKDQLKKDEDARIAKKQAILDGIHIKANEKTTYDQKSILSLVFEQMKKSAFFTPRDIMSLALTNSIAYKKITEDQAYWEHILGRIMKMLADEDKIKKNQRFFDYATNVLKHHYRLRKNNNDYKIKIENILPDSPFKFEVGSKAYNERKNKIESFVRKISTLESLESDLPKDTTLEDLQKDLISEMEKTLDEMSL